MTLNHQDFNALHERALEGYRTFKDRGLTLDMARGKPAPDQLDLVARLLELPGRDCHTASDGTDCRNYGGGHGLSEARALFSKLVGATPEHTVVSGNSSLALMHDCLVYSLLKGNPDSPQPWCRTDGVRFLCPAPGYDYHFNMTEEYGIGMIPVAIGDDGPDMDQVEALVADDASIKGMWCVPKYSNPTGAVYNDEVIERLARMETAAVDFRIFWDNAYAIHHLTEEQIEIGNLLEACARANHPNRALMFASTSKITFPGAGIAVFASSEANVQWFLSSAAKRSIGPDKINQLRHLAALPDQETLLELMGRHRRLLSPKFEAVHSAFRRHFTEPRVATWTSPRGGYFISLFTADGCARRAIELAAAAGIKLTPAGAAFPYGYDPHDHHIRIAPSSLSLADVERAAEGIAAAVLVASTERHAPGNGE